MRAGAPRLVAWVQGEPRTEAQLPAPSDTPMLEDRRWGPSVAPGESPEEPEQPRHGGAQPEDRERAGRSQAIPVYLTRLLSMKVGLLTGGGSSKGHLDKTWGDAVGQWGWPQLEGPPTSTPQKLPHPCLLRHCKFVDDAFQAILSVNSPCPSPSSTCLTSWMSWRRSTALRTRRPCTSGRQELEVCTASLDPGR